MARRRQARPARFPSYRGRRITNIVVEDAEEGLVHHRGWASGSAGAPVARAGKAAAESADPNLLCRLSWNPVSRGRSPPPSLLCVARSSRLAVRPKRLCRGWHVALRFWVRVKATRISLVSYWTLAIQAPGQAQKSRRLPLAGAVCSSCDPFIAAATPRCKPRRVIALAAAHCASRRARSRHCCASRQWASS